MKSFTTNPKLSRPSAGRLRILCRERTWQIFATLACIVYGLTSIANIHPVGDGLWFWYATFLRQGHLLYADMHLPLQPFFVLLTAGSQKVLGNGWLASKVLAVIQLVVYSVGVFLVSGFIEWKDWQKAILIISTFGLMMGTTFFRFDDFHVTGSCFEIYSVYLLLKIDNTISVRISLLMAVLLGVLSGLCLSNRLNDGAVLFAACGFILPVFVRSRKRLAFSLFCLAASITLLSIVVLTGDSLLNWALSSIVHAAAAKGGSGHALHSLLAIPFTIAERLLKSHSIRHNVIITSLIAATCVCIQQFSRRPYNRTSRFGTFFGAVFLLLLLMRFLPNARRGEPLDMMAIVGALVALGLGARALVRLVRSKLGSRSDDWEPRELLSLIPAFQLFGVALTAGKGTVWAYSTVAELILIVLLSFPEKFRQEWKKTAFLTVACWISISAFLYKTSFPYQWHHYTNQRLFAGREWYQHPVYGPMYIEKEQLQLMQSICAEINESSAPHQLLSLPFPYPNYFCNIPPWHDYVQTWYDTSSKQTIDDLMNDLQTSPPQWIVYQRALDTMQLHESVFSDGRLLPQRAIDRLIGDRIFEGTWEVVQHKEFQGADWYLIRTHP